MQYNFMQKSKRATAVMGPYKFIKNSVELFGQTTHHSNYSDVYGIGSSHPVNHRYMLINTEFAAIYAADFIISNKLNIEQYRAVFSVLPGAQGVTCIYKANSPELILYNVKLDLKTASKNLKSIRKHGRK